MSFRVANVVRRVSQATRRLTTDGTASVIGVNLSATKHPAALHNALSLQNASRSEVRQARKQEIIRKYSRCEGDTGSAEVQSK